MRYKSRFIVSTTGVPLIKFRFSSVVFIHTANQLIAGNLFFPCIACNSQIHIFVQTPPQLALRFLHKDEKKELRSLSDELLVTRYAQTHDIEIIGILYERYTHLLFTVCYKYLGNDADAEDIVMLVFEKLFELLKKADIQSFKSWIYTITKNECLMHLRHKKTGERILENNLKKLDTEIMESDEFNHLLSSNDGEQRIRYLETAITGLSSEQKKCIELFYLNEKSYNEVEQITGYTYNEVKSHIQNGKRNLKQLMERMDRYE